MNQKDFVDKCYQRYAELDLQPGNPEDGDWEKALVRMQNAEDRFTIRGRQASGKSLSDQLIAEEANIAGFAPKET